MYLTLCVFLQMKDTKQFRLDFDSLAWIMPQGGTFWRWGCPGGQKFIFFKHGHVAYQIDGDDEQMKILHTVIPKMTTKYP